MRSTEAAKKAMIPVKLVAQPMVTGKELRPFTTTGGACMMDVTGSGSMDLVLMQSGAQAIRVLAQQRRRQL